MSSPDTSHIEQLTCRMSRAPSVHITSLKPGSSLSSDMTTPPISETTHRAVTPLSLRRCPAKTERSGRHEGGALMLCGILEGIRMRSCSSESTCKRFRPFKMARKPSIFCRSRRGLMIDSNSLMNTWPGRE